MSRYNQFFPGSNGLTVRPPKKVVIPGMDSTDLAVNGHSLPCRDSTGNYFVFPANSIGAIKLYRKSDATVVAVVDPKAYLPASPNPPKDSNTGYFGDAVWYDDEKGYLYALFGYPWADGATMRYQFRVGKISDVDGTVTFPGAFFPGSLPGDNYANNVSCHIQGGLLKRDNGTESYDPVTGAVVTSPMTLNNGNRMDNMSGFSKWLSPDGSMAMTYTSNTFNIALQIYRNSLSPKFILAPDYQLQLNGRLWIVEGRAVITTNSNVQAIASWRFYDAADLQRYFDDLVVLATGGF